ncbi:MAG TPA: M28 family peptidase [Anaerolineae bacterium]|nr:M28 family peptidase [Anaerolineae bacterium]
MTRKRFDAGRWLRNNWLELLLLAVLVIAIGWLVSLGREIWPKVRPEPVPTPDPRIFDSQRSLGIVSFLTALGPRVAGSDALTATAERIEQELRESGWQVEVQEFDQDGVARRNIVAWAGSGEPILVGSHYDSSPLADQDPDPANHQAPPPGANDGGSGTAVLLELARVLDKDRLAGQVRLAFFDGQYRADGEAVAAGVQAWATQTPSVEPLQAAVLVDLLGGARQQFIIDTASDLALSQQLWGIAEQLGYAGWFIPEPQAGLNLGQTALADLGGPVAVIAGSDASTWRTLQDTAEQIDPESLGRVGRVLQVFLENQPVSP